MFRLKKINNEVVRAIPKEELKPEQIKGYDLFPEIYSNIFLVARKKSGKTCCIFKILKKCSDKNTRVLIFSSTANRDHNMRKIIKWLDEKEMAKEVYLTLGDDLVRIIRECKEKADVEERRSKSRKEKDEEDEQPKIVSFTEDDDEIEIRIRKRKPKKTAPEIIFIFDDMSACLRSPVIAELVKQNRHYKCKVIISSQYLKDIHPDVRNMIDYWLVYPGQQKEKLEIIYEAADTHVTYDTFVKIYEQATEKRFNFLYVEQAGEFRKNFNELFEIPV